MSSPGKLSGLRNLNDKFLNQTFSFSSVGFLFHVIFKLFFTVDSWDDWQFGLYCRWTLGYSDDAHDGKRKTIRSTLRKLLWLPEMKNLKCSYS